MPATLLLYHRQVGRADAATVMEHVNAFGRYSALPIAKMNTATGLDWSVRRRKFDIIILHYSLFGVREYPIDSPTRDFLRGHSSAYTIAFFQDEYQNWEVRRRFIEEFAVDCVYTLLEAPHAHTVYGPTRARTIVPTLTGYVSKSLLRAAATYAREDADRTIDVGYRGRALPPYMGRDAQEKLQIALEFARRVEGRGMRLDLQASEGARLYGPDWYRFLGNARGVLGVEAGVGVFDLEDEVLTEYDRIQANGPVSEEEMWRRLDPVLARWEGRLPYRTISPRHFEAAAFGAVQILFEGRYNGIMEPGVHYLALRKDFSNIEEVLEHFRSASERQRVSRAARRDLIESGQYSYARFVKEFDAGLERAGFSLPGRLLWAVPVGVVRSASLVPGRVEGRLRYGLSLLLRRLRRRPPAIVSVLLRLLRPLRRARQSEEGKERVSASSAGD